MERVQLAFIGVWELLVILAIVVVIFGAGKLPQLGEALGKTIRNFRKSYKEDPKEIDGEARRLPDTPQPERLAPAPAHAKVPSAERAESKPTVDRP